MQKNKIRALMPEIERRLKTESVRSVYQDLRASGKIDLSESRFYDLVRTAGQDENRKPQPVLPDLSALVNHSQALDEGLNTLTARVSALSQAFKEDQNTRMETLTRALDEITGKFPDADARVPGVEKATRQAAGTAVNPLKQAADDLCRALTAVQSLRETRRRLRWGNMP